MLYNGIPTLWQTVVFRNYGLISNEKIARIIETDETTVIKSAENLGLKNIPFNDGWVKKGFVTIIRNNYDILSDNDIAYILDISLEKFKKLLVEFDFLNVKLGDKPEIGVYKYSELTAEQAIETSKIKKLIEKEVKPYEVQPFDFFVNSNASEFVCIDKFTINERFTSNYCGNYAETLEDDNLSDYSEDYLKRVKACGITGLWIHETLRNLSPFLLDKDYEGDYIKKVENLRKLTERCNKYGIDIYLYFNEPRSLPKEFFDKHPELRGQKTDDGYCLCTSVSQVQNYLYEAVKSIAQNVPLLKGIMTITMSENSTNCYSRFWKGLGQGKTDCPHCKDRSPVEIAAEVNNIMCRALKDGNGYTRLIANTWAWASSMGWSEDMTLKGIELLDKDVDVLCVSEFSKDFERGGVKGQVIDYSISVVGPSEITIKSLERAKQTGHRIWAKVQINNSWECSGVPYIPAFNLMTEHIKKVKKLGVTGLMTGWSLGGFPGGAQALCNAACSEISINEMDWYEKTYAENKEKVFDAVKIFSEAFREYPFSLASVYCGGQHLACGNMWSLHLTGKPSTMVCFATDDEAWAYPYGLDVYIDQLNKLLEKWERGQGLLTSKGNIAFEELKRVAEGVFLHMSAARNLALFVKYKKEKCKNFSKLSDIIACEGKITRRLYLLQLKDAKIGYEISNHYFYNTNLLLEKLLNLNCLRNEIAKINFKKENRI